MKIYLNYQIFYQQKFGGISNYYYHLYKQIKKKSSIKIIAPIHKNFYFQNNPNSIFLKRIPNQLNFIVDFINKKISDYIIKNYRPEVLHNTYYFKNNYSNIKAKKFCTVYDMINEIYPNHFSNSKKISIMKKNTITNSDHIFCISETTKKDLIKIFNVKEEKISVTYLASTLKKNKIQINKEKKFQDCLLFVGSRRGYKNFDGLIESFSKSRILKKNLKIIAFGGEKFSKIDQHMIDKFNLSKNVFFFSDKDYNLNFLYQNVRALIYPSIYEGFGLPLLEAMENGCPIISSNGGSLIEIGGSGLEYFDPHSLKDISSSIERIIFSEEKLKKKILYGFKRNKDFSWEKCAKLTLKKYREL